MRKLEIQAYSLDEAKLIAFKEGITVVQDATISWRRTGSPLLTKELNIFAADFLESKGMFNFKDAGVIITISPGIQDDKKYPYDIISGRRKGRCKLTRTVEIRTQRDDTLLGTASTKTKAIALAKDIIKECKEDIYGKTVYNSSDIDFKMEYKPSIRAKLGQYIVFGVDEADVRISKRRSRGFE